MNRQLVQDIIKAGNKAMNIVPVKYVVKTKNDKYYLKNFFTLRIIVINKKQ